jgi:hypothetical protein
VVIVPVLTYGTQVWFTDHRQGHLTAVLQVAQNEACRKLGGFFRTMPINFMNNLLSIPPIRYRLHHLLWQASDQVPRLPPSVALRNPDRTRRVTGHPRFKTCPSVLPPSDLPRTPFTLPPHPTLPPWTHPRFSLLGKPPDGGCSRWAKAALRSTEGRPYKVWIRMCEAQASGRQLALYCVFRDDTPLFADYTPSFSPGGLLLVLSSAMHRLTPSNEVLIFFQDASFPSLLRSSSSPYLGSLTTALEDYLTASPLASISGFWALRSWPWAGRHTWWDRLLEEEFHASLNLGPTAPPSRARMFLEWATDWVPLGRNDYRRHRRALADPPMVGLYPFVHGVLKRGSRWLQAAAFQVATGHCFAADYSAAFRPQSDDRTDCPDCGAFGSHTHVLDNCPSLAGAWMEWLHNHSSYSIFSCEETGTYLVDFLFHTQRLLRPLDPEQPPPPPEPDP